jgi:hypothetical protein
MLATPCNVAMLPFLTWLYKSECGLIQPLGAKNCVTRPMACKSTEKYPGQRNKEKRELFRPFRLHVIEDLYKRRFFDHFGNCCFKCGKPEKRKQEIGAPPNLYIDHHIPMALGGHLIPGNLVALCRKCNNLKRDKAAGEFYTGQELASLQPLLDAQKELFSFAFDWGKWREDREGYLLEPGVDPNTVYAALHEEYYAGHIGTDTDRIGVTIRLDAPMLGELTVKNPQ